MAKLPRGIDPEILLSQVKNTMPYLFGVEGEGSPFGLSLPGRVLREYESSVPRGLTHFEYYRLCVSAHFLTCATPVPTDVDNQIRHKLWPRELPLEIALPMAKLALEIRSWDFSLFSRRSVVGVKGGSCENELLTAHSGEWFTVAAAAYCALGIYEDPVARQMREALLDQIADEVRRESEIFGSLWRANEGLSSLQASVNIAHNFGDLDRVMDMWGLPITDSLRLRFYKLGITPFDPDGKLRYLGRLWTAGELYKSTLDGSSMALENHRHFALRKAKCLRASPEFLVPFGPFFDDWGRRIAQGLESRESVLEVLTALQQGWERLPKTAGYGRALRGMLEASPDLPLEMPRKGDGRRLVLDTPQERFEKKWNDEAIRLLDEIPSRAS